MRTSARWIAGLWVVFCALAATARAQDFPISGKADPRYAAFDPIVTSAMKQFGATAGMLAIRVNGHVVYERGYGWIDKDKTKPTPPNAMCRIASMTKPITATAIHLLYNGQKVTPDTKVFSYLGIEPLPGATVDPRLKDITIAHLLLHRGGWDRKESSDPTWDFWKIAKAMNLDRPPKPEEIAQYMMGQPLDFAPGERRAYSNFGYMLLGLVIEKASGEGYYDFCEKRIFAPRGLSKDVHPAKARLEDCDPREVYYVDDRMVRSAIDPASKEKVPFPYGGFVPEYRRSLGGWVMTPAAYTRFMDDFGLEGEPLKKGQRWEHDGSQPGVDGRAIWRSDGMKIVLLMDHQVEGGGARDAVSAQLKAAADALAAPKRPVPAAAGSR